MGSGSWYGDANASVRGGACSGGLLAKSADDKNPGTVFFASSACGRVVCTALVLDGITKVSALSGKFWMSKGVGRGKGLGRSLSCVVDMAEDVERALDGRGKVT